MPDTNEAFSRGKIDAQFRDVINPNVLPFEYVLPDQSKNEKQSHHCRRTTAPRLHRISKPAQEQRLHDCHVPPSHGPR